MTEFEGEWKRDRGVEINRGWRRDGKIEEMKKREGRIKKTPEAWGYKKRKRVVEDRWREGR